MNLISLEHRLIGRRQRVHIDNFIDRLKVLRNASCQFVFYLEFAVKERINLLTVLALSLMKHNEVVALKTIKYVYTIFFMLNFEII